MHASAAPAGMSHQSFGIRRAGAEALRTTTTRGALGGGLSITAQL